MGSLLVLSRARKKKKPQERKTASHQERKSNWLAVFLSCGFFFMVSFRAREEPHNITWTPLIHT